MKIKFTLIMCLLFAKVSFSQTLPGLFNLSSGNYTFTTWAAATGAGTFPANMKIHFTNDPSAASANFLVEGNTDYTCGYNLTARNRVNGRDAEGFSFVATSSAQYDNCASGTAASTRFVGAAIVGLNTTGRSNITVSWLGKLYAAGDGTPTPREMAMKLQYRVGATGNYTDVVDVSANPVLFSSLGRVANETATITGTLPAACNNKAEVYVRWIYAQIAANSGGTRPELGIGNIQISGQAVAPLTLKHFSGTVDANKVSLTWETINELNVSHFEIEKSTDAQNFSFVGKLAANNTGAENSYTYTDIATGKTSFYRLRIVDKDGSYKYSGIVKVDANEKGSIKLFPNPVTTSVTVTHAQATNNSVIKIVAADGRTVLEKNIQTGSTTNAIDVSKLVAGKYILLVQNANGVQNAGFMKL